MISAELAEKCGVINFLQDVKDKPEVNHDTLVFAVQLAGRLVSKITFSEAHLSIMSTLIESVLSNNLMESLSVSCALFTTLTAVLHGPCVIDFFENLNLKGRLTNEIGTVRCVMYGIIFVSVFNIIEYCIVNFFRIVTMAWRHF